MSREAMEARDASPGYEVQAVRSTVPAGYKQTEVGVIPEDWEVRFVEDFYEVTSSKRVFQSDWRARGVPFYRTREIAILAEKGSVENGLYIDESLYDSYAKRYGVPKCGDLLVTGIGTIGKAYLVPGNARFYFKDASVLWFSSKNIYDSGFLKYLFQSPTVLDQINDSSTGTTVDTYTISGAKRTLIPEPPLSEQRAIATALSDVDALLEELDRLITKRRDLKRAAMQQLLTGQTRLPGFDGEFESKTLEESADCLDNLRVPLNESQRAKMRGSIPYCGANGVLDYINDYIIDDDVILMAEDGGHFDEYETRPIAYRMSGKCWVNNHAHILKAKTGHDQGFLYYSLVHKNILPFLASGTRAKLNRSELNKIEVQFPRELAEQTAISSILSDIDAEIDSLEQRRAKTSALKQAMMQELLTGRTRLVKPAEQTSSEDTNRPGGRNANVYFMRSVLAAEIVDRLHAEPTFGHVKFEKVLFLVEHLCEVDTGSTYHRKAAGPYDNRALRSIDSQMQKQRWFEARKKDGRYRYVPLDRRGRHKAYFDRYFSNVSDTFGKIVETLRKLDTEQCEIVGTLFSAWSDLLREHGAVPDQMIVHEVLNNWHESKQRIPEDRWFNALVWMREKGFVPKEAVSS